MKDIIIVGGGTAGLVTALILKTKFNVNIKIIKSDEIDIIGVGEGSTEHWQDFMGFCGIDYKELIKETDATIKLGIYFTGGWAKNNFYHNISSHKSLFKFGQTNYGLLQSLSKNEKPILTTTYLNLENLVPNFIDGSPSNQYHFNTFKLNSFLLKKCKEKKIDIVKDTIKKVNLDQNGISSLIGSKKYKANFYVDCTGFKRLLISKVGAKWISYSKHFNLNEAIAFPTEDTNEYTPYTESKKMNAGWMWRIPTYGRWGNGYVFNSHTINADQALQEVENNRRHSIKDVRHVKFNPGALDKPLLKNCLAVGLAANFVEPLEATSIGTTINQVFLFNNYFNHVNSKYHVDEYNNKMSAIMDNIKDFVLIHYINDKTVKIPESLKYKLNLWKERPPIDDDFTKTHYYLFYAVNFMQVLCGLNFYKPSIIKRYINTLNKEVRSNFDTMIKEKDIEYKINRNQHISHKQWLMNIRDENT